MKKTYDLVLFSTFASIILFLALIPNIGYITIIPGVASVTIIHIPVLIGIMFLPFYYSLGLGFVFGLSSFIASFIYAQSLFDYAFQNPIISFVPRILFALVAYFIIKGLMKLKELKNGLIINFIIVFLSTSIFIAIGSYSLIKITSWPSAIIYLFGFLLIIGLSFLFFKYINKKDSNVAYVPTSLIVSTFVHTLLVLTFVALIRVDAYEGANVLEVILIVLGTNGILEAMIALLIGTPIVISLHHLMEEKRWFYYLILVILQLKWR